MLIDLTAWEHLHILGENEGRGMCKSGICDREPAISLKRSSYYSVYYELAYGLSIGDKLDTYRVNFGILFRGAKFFHNGYVAHFLPERDEIWHCYG